MEFIAMKKNCQLFFLLFIRLKSSDLNVLNDDTINRISMRPVKDLEIRCYLIEENRLKLWLFLLNTQTSRKILLDNKKFSFERNVLKKIQYIKFHDSLNIQLILSITKTETHFKIHITSFTCI